MGATTPLTSTPALTDTEDSINFTSPDTWPMLPSIDTSLFIPKSTTPHLPVVSSGPILINSLTEAPISSSAAPFLPKTPVAPSPPPVVNSLNAPLSVNDNSSSPTKPSPPSILMALQFQVSFAALKPSLPLKFAQYSSSHSFSLPSFFANGSSS